MIEWLQEWYLRHCNGNWEHQNGINIYTVDNPGWSISINLRGTSLEGVEIAYSLNEISETEWEGYLISNNIFKGGCSPTRLNNIIEVFKNIVESP